MRSTWVFVGEAMSTRVDAGLIERGRDVARDFAWCLAATFSRRRALHVVDRDKAGLWMSRDIGGA